MSVTVFTSNSQRHNYLVNKILDSGFEVNLIQELPIKNVIHGTHVDDESFKEYFNYVKKSEIRVFGDQKIDIGKLRGLSQIDFGQISSLNPDNFRDILNFNVVIITIVISIDKFTHFQPL